LLKQYGERVELENRLNAIHSEIDVHTLTEQVTERPMWIVNLWRHHHSKISVAASIAIFVVLAVLFVTGKMDNNSAYTDLRMEMAKIRYRQDHIKFPAGNVRPTSPVIEDKYRGTGFAITSNGFIATAFHVIERADSVYVQNYNGNVFKAKVVYTDPKSDVAILKITDTSFKNLGAIPYTFKHSESELAENVFTYGYPQNGPVYNAGWVTAQNGLNNDSIDYQISIPINAGSSGSPLLDGKGNIVGIVKAKETRLEGVHFALKSNYLINAIENIPTDSVTRKPVLNTKNTMAGLSRKEQVKKLENYVFIVKVY